MPNFRTRCIRSIGISQRLRRRKTTNFKEVIGIANYLSH